MDARKDLGNFFITNYRLFDNFDIIRFVSDAGLFESVGIPGNSIETGRRAGPEIEKCIST